MTLPLMGVQVGLYNITIRNSDGVNVTAEDIFSVPDQAWISSTKKTVSRSPIVQGPAKNLTSAGLIPQGRAVIGGGGVVVPMGR